MGLLQYTSNEMYSATELIRKSKMIFDKLSDKEIEKAIILRDGKPSFMLLEFTKYEKLITEYLLMQEELEKYKNKENHQVHKISKIETIVKPQNILPKEESIPAKEIHLSKEINSLDLENALAKIDELDFTPSDEPKIEEKIKPAEESASEETITENKVEEESEPETQKEDEHSQKLKDFWE